MNGDTDAVASKERKQEQQPPATAPPEEASSTTTPLIPPPAPTVPPITLTGPTGSRAGEDLESEKGKKEEAAVEEHRRDTMRRRSKRQEADRKEKEKTASKLAKKKAKQKANKVGETSPANPGDDKNLEPAKPALGFAKAPPNRPIPRKLDRREKTTVTTGQTTVSTSSGLHQSWWGSIPYRSL